MIINHTDCGMLRFTDREFEERLRKETGQAPIAPRGSTASPTLRRTPKSRSRRPGYIHGISPDVPVRGFVMTSAPGRLSEVFPDGETVAG